MTLSGLRAGAARIEITPTVPTPMAGYPVIHIFDDGPRDHVGYVGRQGLSDGTHDALWARALALADRAQTLVLVAVDLCMVTAEFTREVRERVALAAGIEPSGLLIAASHTHSGPELFGQWEPAVPNTYARAREQVVQVVLNALDRLQPAAVGWGRGTLAEPIVNRRDPSRPIDPEVGLLRVEGSNGELIAAVVNYACHPIVVGAGNRLFSADFPGYAASVVERAHEGAICLFLNGAAGNINPTAFPYASDRNVSALARARVLNGQPVTFRSHAEARRFGNALGGEALRSLELVQVGADANLSSRHRSIIVPLKPAAELDRFVQQWGVQSWVRETYAERTECELGLHGVRIGQGGFVGVPGEPFVEFGLELKHAIGGAPVFMAGYANDYPGYIPTAHDFEENRYESVATPLGASAPTLVQQATVALAADLGFCSRTA